MRATYTDIYPNLLCFSQMTGHQKSEPSLQPTGMNVRCETISLATAVVSATLVLGVLTSPDPDYQSGLWWPRNAKFFR